MQNLWDGEVKTMIVILGESGSGKSYIEKELCKNGYDRIISYTTRPIRENEIDGVDYHFVSESYFRFLKEDNFFAESTQYNSWYYGIAKKDCLDNKIVVVEPYGFRQLKSIDDLNITSFYIKVPEHERAKRMIDRKDNLLEVFRRLFSDQGVFLGVENEVDYIVNNENFQGLEQILNILKGAKYE